MGFSAWPLSAFAHDHHDVLLIAELVCQVVPLGDQCLDSITIAQCVILGLAMLGSDVDLHVLQMQ